MVGPVRFRTVHTNRQPECSFKTVLKDCYFEDADLKIEGSVF